MESLFSLGGYARGPYPTIKPPVRLSWKIPNLKVVVKVVSSPSGLQDLRLGASNMCTVEEE